jgi:hypothetical protein
MIRDFFFFFFFCVYLNINLGPILLQCKIIFGKCISYLSF